MVMKGMIQSFKLTPRRSQFGVPDFVCVCACFLFQSRICWFFYESVLSLKSVRAGWIAEELVLQRLGSDKLPGLRSMI